jgi:PRTRC genetic system protein C
VEIKQMKRVFDFNGKKLPDPNPKWTPDQVINFYSNTYPELTTATVDNGETDLKKGTITYTISKTLGTKG